MTPRRVQFLQGQPRPERRIYPARREPDGHHHPHGGPYPGARGRAPDQPGRAWGHYGHFPVHWSGGQSAGRAFAGAYTETTPAAVVYKATWPEQKTVHCTVGTLAASTRAAGITKIALIVVGDFLAAQYDRSKLYDPTFTTEYRKGRRNDLRVSCLTSKDWRWPGSLRRPAWCCGPLRRKRRDPCQLDCC